MNLRKIFLCFITPALLASPAFAQEDIEPFSQLSVGLKASTMGYGLEAATPLGSKFVLRAGVNLTLGFQSDYVNIVLPDENDNLYDAFGYVPEYRAKLGMNFTHGNVLVDYHPAGIFHLTAGFYVGNSSFGIHGFMADWHNNNAPSKLLPGYEWPSIDLLDQKVDLTGGKANIDFQLGGIIKPYIGLGVGRAISKNKKLSVKFELGALYLGEYTLKQNGKKLDLSKSTDPDIRDVHDILKQVTAYPLMNLQLTYRIF